MAEHEAPSAAPIDLPVINISKITPTVGKATVGAAVKYGFLYVDSASTVFSDVDVNQAFDLARNFFASPYEEKARFKIGPNNRGWSGMHTETLDPEHQQRGDFKEAMNIGEYKNGKPQQELPDALAPHEADIGRFMELCQKTCNSILALLALGLGIPENWFTNRHDTSLGPSGCTFRYLFYPPLQTPATSGFKHGVDVRAGAHSDYGSITLLFQRDGQPGLEILTPAGEWAPVPVRPAITTSSSASGPDTITLKETTFPPILVNIGDLLSYWTCGLLKSTVHRVVFPLEEQQRQPGSDKEPSPRYSMVYFCHPANDTELVPVPSKLVEEYRRETGGPGPRQRSDGVPLTAKDHLQERLTATYGAFKEKDQ